MEQNVLIHLGNCVRRARKECGLTQEQLADCIGGGTRNIQKIEKGETNTSFDKLYQIVRRLGISAEVLFYPEKACQSDDLQHIMGKLAACTEEERSFLIHSLDYMASQLLSQRCEKLHKEK